MTADVILKRTDGGFLISIFSVQERAAALELLTSGIEYWWVQMSVAFPEQQLPNVIALFRLNGLQVEVEE